jgi:hypothetical protein
LILRLECSKESCDTESASDSSAAVAGHVPEADNVPQTILEQARQLYPTIKQARIAIQALDPSARTTGNYDTVTKRLARVIYALQTDNNAPLKTLTSTETKSVPDTVRFYRSTFNLIDRVDNFLSKLVWPTNVCSRYTLVLLYMVRLVIFNVHAATVEYQQNSNGSRTAKSTDNAGEFVDSDQEVTRIRDTLTRLRADMLASEPEFRRPPPSNANQRSTIRTNVSSPTTSQKLTGKKRKRG